MFGSPLDEERYKKVLEQCALEQDLSLFAAGDMTEVGEKGLTLRSVLHRLLLWSSLTAVMQRRTEGPHHARPRRVFARGDRPSR